MSVETYRVLMGACGWKHQAWLNDFYSEDLPEDWQLGFYSNEFPVVYVAAEDWLETADFSEWTEDITDSFRFILEIPANVLNDEQLFDAALKKTKILGEFCLGLVFQLDQDIVKNISLFEKHLHMAKIISPVCIDKSNAELSDEFNDVLLKQDVSDVWHGESEEIENLKLKSGALAISRIACDGLDMAGLRKVIEVCLAVSDENCTSVLCLDGEPPSLEILRNANIILDLL